MLFVPISALEFGFYNGPGGTHTSRTIMLQEVSLLLDSCAPTSDYPAYEGAIVDDNVLLKQTASTRKRTLRGLRELYGLDPGIPLFHALRDLWDESIDAQPVLALQCAIARDPLLRSTSKLILSTPFGASVSSDQLSRVIEQAFPDRYNSGTLGKIGRNSASSWTQGGYLQGRTSKTRARITPTASSVAYALLQGHLCGERGEVLFDTIWIRLLDAPAHELRELAVAASRLGYIDLRQAGAVTEVTFSYLLRDEEKASDDE